MLSIDLSANLFDSASVKEGCKIMMHKNHAKNDGICLDYLSLARKIEIVKDKKTGNYQLTYGKNYKLEQKRSSLRSDSQMHVCDVVNQQHWKKFRAT